ncbi:MAG: uridine kinase [Thermoleophilia bacterium]|nr:uridine kinase [Thermoleophilia bacterium]
MEALTEQELVSRLARDVIRLAAGARLRVGIDGICASGKSTLARALVAQVAAGAVPARFVSSDGFHLPRAARHRGGRRSAEGYLRDTYDVAAIRDRLQRPLGAGGDGRFAPAVFDLAADRAVEAEPELAPEGLVVVYDGTFCLRPELRDGWDLRVALRVDRQVAEDRLVARERAALGDDARTLAQERYHAAWDLYAAEADPERAAHVVVDNTDPARPVVLADRLR